MNAIGPRRSYLLILSLFAAFGSFECSATVQWLQSNVKSVYPLEDGSFVLLFTSDSPACTNTNSPNKYYYVTAGQNGVTSDGVKAMLATALTAFVAGRTLTVVFDDSTPYCYINRFNVT